MSIAADAADAADAAVACSSAEFILGIFIVVAAFFWHMAALVAFDARVRRRVCVQVRARVRVGGVSRRNVLQCGTGDIGEGAQLQWGQLRRNISTLTGSCTVQALPDQKTL